MPGASMRLLVAAIALAGCTGGMPAGTESTLPEGTMSLVAAAAVDGDHTLVATASFTREGEHRVVLGKWQEVLRVGEAAMWELPVPIGPAYGVFVNYSAYMPVNVPGWAPPGRGHTGFTFESVDCAPGSRAVQTSRATDETTVALGPVALGPSVRVQGDVQLCELA